MVDLAKRIPFSRTSVAPEVLGEGREAAQVIDCATARRIIFAIPIGCVANALEARHAGLSARHRGLPCPTKRTVEGEEKAFSAKRNAALSGVWSGCEALESNLPNELFRLSYATQPKVQLVYNQIFTGVL